ncbi:MAG: sulfite exporter TauE/SafE family protein [Bacteroidia bacterium]|nr:sulfite exporter TauE/SafE family protein [Bacteroidia bacterium]
MIWAALILGLGGSLHCAAMCGPLVFSVQQNWGIKGLNLPLISYHGGRLIAYLGLGLGLSLIKLPVHLFNLQQYIALVSGILLLLFVFKNRIPLVRGLMNRISNGLSSSMQRHYGKKRSLPIIGFLNGLLPCGLSYSAAAISVGQPQTSDSLLFMLFFGLGTLPMFLVGSYVGQKLRLFSLKRINRYMHYSMALVGLLLVLRGSGLNIPYVSPNMDAQTSEMNCCHPD